MDQEKDIQEMATIMEAAKIKALGYLGSMNEGFGMWHARALAAAGYGSTKRAVKNYADKVKDRLAHVPGLEPYQIKYILGDLDA